MAKDKRVVLVPNKPPIPLIPKEEEIRRLLLEYDNFKDPSVRDLICTAIVGSKGAGKSSWMRQEAEAFMKETTRNGQSRRVLIHTPTEGQSYGDLTQITLEELVRSARLPNGHPDKWTTGIRYIKSRKGEHEETIKVIAYYYTNGALFMDECNEWIEVTGNPPYWQRVLFSQNRQRVLDIYFCIHRLDEVHRKMRPHCWSYVLFKSDEQNVKGAEWFEKNGFPPDHTEFYNLWLKVQKFPYLRAARQQYCEIFIKKR
jgi:hypothetical protein